MAAALVEAPSGVPSGFGAHASVAVTDFSYRELADSGALLDREDGLLPGMALGASWRSGPWEVAADVGFLGQIADYSGRTSTGIAITTDTSEEMRSGAIRAWRRLDLAGIAVAPHGAVRYHRWDRSIRSTRTASGTPVNGLFERYEWWTAELGVEVLVLRGERLRAWMDARLFRTLRPTVEIAFENGLDDARLALGERTGHRLSIAASYALTPSVDLRAEPYYEAFGFGRSDAGELTRAGVRAGTVHEPRSETRNVGLAVGASRRF
jgi:hypothetical protein